MPTDELTNKLVSWIKETVTTGGSKGVVLGISGGIDSAIAAVLCQQAFPDSTLGVAMPCYSLPEDEEHARLVAKKFSISLKTIVLDSAFDTLVDVLPEDSAGANTAPRNKANIKARLRMVTLYYLANQYDYMVVGSSNRSELEIGYFTKYGDGGVDFMPLGNLVKAQIVELARFLAIPQEIIDKPPSAGLWAGQTDEDELNLKYVELDRYLVSGEAPEEVKTRIESMKSMSVHKRETPPVPPF